MIYKQLGMGRAFCHKLHRALLYMVVGAGLAKSQLRASARTGWRESHRVGRANRP